MIFKVKFPDREEFAQAKNLSKLQQGYKNTIGNGFLLVKSVTIIDKEEAKSIMVVSNEPDGIKEVSLFDTCIGDDFYIIGAALSSVALYKYY